MIKLLKEVCKNLPEDYEPYGNTEYRGPDCSCGCQFFVRIAAAKLDYGVCVNQKSHRAGLLTFEHQGCPYFEPEKEL